MKTILLLALALCAAPVAAQAVQGPVVAPYLDSLGYRALAAAHQSGNHVPYCAVGHIQRAKLAPLGVVRFVVIDSLVRASKSTACPAGTLGAVAFAPATVPPGMLRALVEEALNTHESWEFAAIVYDVGPVALSPTRLILSPRTLLLMRPSPLPERES